MRVIQGWTFFEFTATIFVIKTFVSQVKGISSFWPIQQRVVNKSSSVLGLMNVLFMDVMGSIGRSGYKLYFRDHSCWCHRSHFNEQLDLMMSLNVIVIVFTNLIDSSIFSSSLVHVPDPSLVFIRWYFWFLHLKKQLKHPTSHKSSWHKPKLLDTF